MGLKLNFRQIALSALTLLAVIAIVSAQNGGNKGSTANKPGGSTGPVSGVGAAAGSGATGGTPILSTSYGYYLDSSRTCGSVTPAQASLGNPSDQASFDQGAGVTGLASGQNAVLYKGGQFYCCADQMYRNVLPVNGCENVASAGGLADPWFSSAGSSVNLVLSVLTERTPASGQYFVSNPRSGKRSEQLYSTYTSPSTPSSQLSYQGDTLLGYSSSFFNTPVASNFGTDWYGYFKKLVEVNLANVDAGKRIVELSNPTLGGVIGLPNEAVVRKGDLSVSAGTLCNSRTIIFVEGNLTITPPFTLNSRDLNQQRACLFIVKGNVSIPASTNSNTVTLGSADYDLLEAGIISNGEINAAYDGVNGRGLYVRGFLSGGLGKFNRDTSNESSPSLFVEYDPRFIELFKQELKLLKFSTREKGFDSSL